MVADFRFKRNEQVVFLSVEKYFSTFQKQLAPIRIGGAVLLSRTFISHLLKANEHDAC